MTDSAFRPFARVAARALLAIAEAVRRTLAATDPEARPAPRPEVPDDRPGRKVRP